MKAQSQPGDRDRFPPTIHLQTQIRMHEPAMATVAATMSLAAPTLSRVRKIRGRVPLSGNGRPCLARARRRRSASTIFSRDLPAKVEYSPNPIGPLQSHIPLAATIQGLLQPPAPRSDCLRRCLLHHTPRIQTCRPTAATHHLVISYRR